MAEAATKATALWVVRRLRRAGHSALLAGGCVRDMLLERRSADYDVATDATPGQVRRLFPRVLLVGAKFGVAMVIHRQRKVEVATFRSDAGYSDGRRPDGVRFSSPREDALRRDFTINGMFLDPLSGEVFDYVGARDDLRRRVIRTIGPPDLRFAEDYLRMLRAVRLSVRLDFAIDPATAQAVRKHAPRITAISGERIFDELSRMLARASAAQALRLMEDLGLARHVLGKLPDRPGTWPAAIDRVEAVASRKDATLALAALLGELPGETISRMVRHWGAGNELRDAVVWLAGNLHAWRHAAELPLAEFRPLAGHAQFHRLRTLWRAEEQRLEHTRRQSLRIAARLRDIPAGEPALPKPFVKGDDLIAMGLGQGPALGRTLRELYDAQLNLVVRDRASAVALARRLLAARRHGAHTGPTPSAGRRPVIDDGSPLGERL
jgi:poly(A) polymerase